MIGSFQISDVSSATSAMFAVHSVDGARLTLDRLRLEIEMFQDNRPSLS